jgi:hypothetical protein
MKIETEILAELSERLEVGERLYGPFDEDDPRDMTEEAIEEVLDALIYTAFQLYKLKRRHHERNR